MKITDYKQYIVFSTWRGESQNFKFPEEFHLFYERAESAFGGVKLIDRGEIIAAGPVDHIHWQREDLMLEYIRKVFEGSQSLI